MQHVGGIAAEIAAVANGRATLMRAGRDELDQMRIAPPGLCARHNKTHPLQDGMTRISYCIGDNWDAWDKEMCANLGIVNLSLPKH